MRIKGISIIIVTFGVLLLGAWSSFALFRFLASNVRPPRTVKDTVYVKVLNDLPYRTDTIIGRVAGQDRVPDARNGTKASHSSAFTDSGIKFNQKAFLPRPPMVRLPDDSLRNATAAARLSQATFSWRFAIFGVIFVFAVVVLLLYNRLPFFATDLQKDLDPIELTEVFRRFSDPIEAIGNPRKIKRLSNKIRFQYHYIAGKGWHSPDIFTVLVGILLTLEKKPWFNGSIGISGKPDLGSEDKFWEYFSPNAGASPTIASNKNLQHLIYILNRDPL